MMNGNEPLDCIDMNEANQPNMTDDEAYAYQWALNQKFQSVAARYARTLAKFIRRNAERLQ